MVALTAFIQPLLITKQNYTPFDNLPSSRKSQWVANPLLISRSSSISKRSKFPSVQAHIDKTHSNDTDNISDFNLSKEEQEIAHLIDEVDVKPLRWSEIPFANIEEELAAIDDYERQEELEENDAWPKFLRGAAYEHWGRPQLALAQYRLVDDASGLRRVPELWERRAYNSFKLGNVGAASAYFDVGLGLYFESVGNELHFVHWFHENFKDYVPKENGPPAPIQRGICKYCMGQMDKARQSFVAQIPLRRVHMEHAVLWLLAASASSSEDGLARPIDLNVARDALEDYEHHNPKLARFIKLFIAAGEGRLADVEELENELSNEIKQTAGDDIITNVYVALYHDAFTKDVSERDRSLDLVTVVGSTASPNDVENFLFCAAKNRFTAPPGAENEEVPERTVG